MADRIEVSEPIASGRMVSSSSTSVSGRMPKSVVSEPCGSVSITSTLCPSSVSPWASVTAVVVLVTPPLKLPIAMVTASPPAGRSHSLRYSRIQVRASARLNSRRLPASFRRPVGKSPRERRWLSEPFSMPSIAASWLRLKTGGALRAVGASIAVRISPIIATARSAWSRMPSNGMGRGGLIVMWSNRTLLVSRTVQA